MSEVKRSVDEVIAWSRAQIANPTQDWTGLCQSHVRQAMGLGAWAPSAIEAWERIPAEHKFTGGKVTDAPRGAQMYYDIGTFGHVVIAIGRNTDAYCLSNDYIRQGHIDRAPRALPRWGAKYLGWSAWTPYGVLDLSAPKVEWDDRVPSYDGIMNAMADPDLANPAAYRLACRLADLGFFEGKPVEGEQGYPRKAIAAVQKARGFKVTGEYGPKMHKYLFGVAP